MNNQDIVKHFGGRIIRGVFKKIDGSRRKFWGVLKYEDRDVPNLVTVYDFSKKAYRRFRLDQGSIVLNSGDRWIKHNQIKGSTLILLNSGEELNISAETKAKFLLISGKPIGEQIARGGPFVMNTKEEITQAISDYQSGNFVK